MVRRDLELSYQLRDLDAQLDRLQLDRVPALSEPVSPISAASFRNPQHGQQSAASAEKDFTPTPHAKNLQRIIKSLSSVTSSERPPSPKKLVALLKEANITKPQGYESYEEFYSQHYQYEVELEWLLLSKATIQTYGIVLNYLVEQTLPLSQDLFYWDEILGSYRWLAWYSLSTTPQRIVNGAQEVFLEASRRFKEIRELERVPFLPQRHLEDDEESILSDDDHSGIHHRYQPPQPPPSKPQSLSANLRKFYSLVKNTLRDRSYIELYRISALSPFAVARQEVRKKQAAIRKLRELQASALGVLIGEGLSFEFEEEHDEWKGIIERAVTLIENVVRNVASVDQSLEEFEEMAFALDKPRAESPDDDEELMTASGTLQVSTGIRAKAATAALSQQLQEILTQHLPAQSNKAKALITSHGRPGIITRYWIPATALLLSSTTMLKILVRRQVEIQTWLRELGATIIDFWANWVIEPVRKIVATIRHTDSEVALMSRSSLTADMNSLERMVVDFAIDNPDVSELIGGVNETQLEAIRAKVKEGDLTPVLKVYERDLRSPFKGAVKGELVRALLIQIQKTKVDVEVAIAGIDRLLKSQELVFGFLGLTPGVLVCFGVFRYMSTVLGGGKGKKFGKKSEQMLRTLRNIDKILTGSRAVRGSGRDIQRGLLSYKEHGLLMCEIHVLRELARGVLPRERWSEFVADLEELGEVRSGIEKQSRVVERLRWAYRKWIR
ncbi:Nuclear control of ATPase protein 2 [Rhizina undulata]